MVVKIDPGIDSLSKNFTTPFCYLQSILFLGRWRGFGGKGFGEFLVIASPKAPWSSQAKKNALKNLDA